jgi:hypothetical protein
MSIEAYNNTTFIPEIQAAAQTFGIARVFPTAAATMHEGLSRDGDSELLLGLPTDQSVDRPFSYQPTKCHDWTWLRRNVMTRELSSTLTVTVETGHHMPAISRYE